MRAGRFQRVVKCSYYAIKLTANSCIARYPWGSDRIVARAHAKALNRRPFPQHRLFRVTSRWLLRITSLRPEMSRKKQTRKESIMNKIIVTLAFALIAPLAFAQTGSKGKRQEATTAEPVKVTGTIVKMTAEEGAAASYQPIKTLVVREDKSNAPGTYVLKGPGHVVDNTGKVIQTAIKPGARVRVYYANEGGSRMVDHVVVLD